MHLALWVGLGGAAGSIARFLISARVQALSGGLGFPYGTLLVNLVGCFLIGLLGFTMDAHGLFDARYRALIFVGFLGGFTTYSSFAAEAVGLGRAGRGDLLLLDLGLHVGLGLAAVWLGRAVARSLLG